MVKNSPANAGLIRDVCLNPESGRSPGGGHGNPLQSSRLENPMDRGAWWGIPWTEEPGGLWSIRSQRVGHKLRQLSMHMH